MWLLPSYTVHTQVPCSQALAVTGFTCQINLVSEVYLIMTVYSGPAQVLFSAQVALLSFNYHNTEEKTIPREL